ncbi:protein kinase domain-containing protein [Sulfuracidifex tepidarius]|uniref:Serine/threonine-protein kinase PknD n=1 Tax=Sulfuracidifex tepidarius TaxID=1294262 RepID=A0A510DRY6_9CREN|nr:protein kinase [Sulfuracidifex tepidarius]BBG22905.1 Serine/threonine-protein kinase PknD [Sulfuracidifex tepidarius]BBG25665.1 Serine/threonine-protein kinase PknD [Sulfuracidifex tepidarius]
MQFVVFKDGNKYFFENGKVIRYDGKIKVKGNVVGYVVSVEGGKVKLTSIPVLVPSNEVVDVRLSAFAPELGFIFESNDAVYLYSGKLDSPTLNAPYQLIYGVPVLRGSKSSVMSAAKDPKVAEYVIRLYKDQDLLREAFSTLASSGECEKVVKSYRELKITDPEISMIVAPCMEKTGEELEALKIYSFFSEEKYRELEARLRGKANSLIDNFYSTKNVKFLQEAMNVLPTYDAPSLSMGWYFFDKRDFSAAKDNFEEASRKKPTFHNLLMLAWSYIQLGDYRKALEVIERAEKIKRNAGSAYVKGLALEGLNAGSMAEREFMFACREGVIDACRKFKPYKLFVPEVFDPSSWTGYVMYGYEIKGVLGTGGMGYVLLAEKNGKSFAMKVMKKDYTFVEMLYEVAKMQEISKRSDNLVRVYASFLDENWTDYFSSPPTIVMDYMEGGDLREVLVNEEYSALRHSVKWPQVVALMFSRIGRGVIDVHKEGYVHCDIKPSNILFNKKLPKMGEDAMRALLSFEVTPKLSDLGSALKVGVPAVHYTPYYAHPMQRFGMNVDYQFDVYSFTVSLYVALTNNFPFSEWAENEIEDAVKDRNKRQTVLREFYELTPRLDYVPHEFHDLILSGLRGETTMEEAVRSLDSILLYDYGIEVPWSNQRSGVTVF